MLFRSVNFDVLLASRLQQQADVRQFYIFRANSNNCRVNVAENEFMLPLTYQQIFRLVTHAQNTQINDLEIYFTNSDVVVDQILTIVFSFFKI